MGTNYYAIKAKPTVQKPIDIDGYFEKSLREAVDTWNRRVEEDGKNT